MEANIKRGNNGFSLIELIIVVAIMAVLTAVLAPQFLKYVDKARRQNDVNSAYEMVNAMKVLQIDIDSYTYSGSYTSGGLAAIMINKKQLIETYGSEEEFLEFVRNPSPEFAPANSEGKKLIYADFFDIMGGIPETSLGEDYSWFIGLEKATGNTELVAIHDADMNNIYMLYPEHDRFMKGIGITQEEFSGILEDISNR